MHSGSFDGLRGRLAASFLTAALLFCGSVLAATVASAPRYERRGPLHCIVERGVSYSFDPVWRVEALSPAARCGGVSLPPETDRAQRLDRMRGLLLRELGVTSLDEISREGESELGTLRSLGYL